MKLKRISITDFPPIKNIEMADLGNVVIIAGANGSGKSRLKDAIIQTIQGNPLMSMTIEATRPDENKKYFDGSELEVVQGQPNQKLSDYINSRPYTGGQYVGSVVQVDSKRNIQNITYSQVNWLGADPDDSSSPANYYFGDFGNRWQDFMSYIHQKSASRDRKLADQIKNTEKSREEILSINPDPIIKYQELFSTLLPGKKLLPLDLSSPREFAYIDETGNQLPFSNLSSGEQEVIKVIFDLARKEIRHSVVIVDEPELHLHPSLTFKLVETLKTLGNGTNQFIYLTHSPDLISTYYSSGDVYFIDAEKNGNNEAHKLSELEDDHPVVAQMIGDNLGLFSSGKMLIFVEGENSSIDRLSYQLIAQKYAKEAKIVPLGGVTNLISLSKIKNELETSIFGIKFFLIRDRDGLTDSEVLSLENNGAIKCLNRRHIENYFLDEEVLSKVAKHLFLNDSDPNLNNKDWIKNQILEIVKKQKSLNLLQSYKEMLSLQTGFKIPTVRDAINKAESEIINSLLVSTDEEITRLTDIVDREKMNNWLATEATLLDNAINDGSWINNFHGKLIFTEVCSKIMKGDINQIRHSYVEIALSEKPNVFQDIEEIMIGFTSD
jgi:predicted ATPase